MFGRNYAIILHELFDLRILGGSILSVIRFASHWLFVILIALCLGVLAACGGGSGSSTATGMVVTTIDSTLNLGASGVDPATLQIQTSISSGPVESDGTAEVDVFDGGPQYAEVTDSAGRTVLLSYIGEENPIFSAQTTAAALGYLYLSGPGLKGDARVRLLTEMDTLPGFDAFVAAIQSQLDTDGYLNFDSPTFQSAVETFVTGNLTRSRGVIADPTTASGLSLDTTVQDKLTVQNVYLRRVNLYLKRVSYVDKDGKAVDDTSPSWAKTEMPLVARYGGITGTIDGFLKGEVPYSPVSTNPALEIPLLPNDAQQTKYEMYAAGPGFKKNAHYNSAPALIRDDLTTLELKTLFLDVFLVVLSNVALPVKGDQVDDFLKYVGGNAVVTDLINNLKTTIPQLSDQVAAGDYAGAMKSLFTSAYTSNTILPAMAQVMLDYLSYTSISDASYDQIFSGMKGLLDKMGKIDVGFTVADLGILFHDIMKSEKIEKFTLTVTPGKITLQAGATKLKPTATTTIKAIIQDKDPSGTYEYEWKVSPNDDYELFDKFTNSTSISTGGLLVTSEDTVTIKSKVTTEGTAIVYCEAFRTDGGRRSVAKAQLSIAFSNESGAKIEGSHEWQYLSGILQTTDQHGAPLYQPQAVAFFDVPRRTGANFYELMTTRISSGTVVKRYLNEPVSYPLTGLPNPATVVRDFGEEVMPTSGSVRFLQWPSRGSHYTKREDAVAALEGLLANYKESQQDFQPHSITYMH